MSEQIIRANEFQPGDAALQQWQEPRAESPPPVKSPIERPLAAIRRYKWLMLAVVIVATAGGIIASRMVKPLYEVHATIMLSAQSPMEAQAGPIRSSELLASDDWVQLLKSYRIVDAVVMKLSLYLQPDDPKDRDMFAGFAIGNQGYTGQYELHLDQAKKTWQLDWITGGGPADAGGVADSVGRRFGFSWVLPRSAFYSGKGERTIKFKIITPRETGLKLVTNLATRLAGGSNFIQIAYDDADPVLAARTINTWLDEYVRVAETLKKRKLVEFRETLEKQLKTSKDSLDNAEVRLQGFRVSTITEPSEKAGPMVAGITQTTDPVIKDYFDRKIEYDDIKHDVVTLQAVVSGVGKDSVSADALLQIPSVIKGGPAADALRSAFAEYTKVQSDLTGHLVVYTDENPIVKADRSVIATLKNEKIPQLARELLASLRTKATEDSLRIASATPNLQQIPERTIEEERLRRRREVANGIYTTLSNRSAEAELAEASATPDVTVLDTAIAPFSPTTNTKSRMLFVAIAGGFGAAIALAILLDKIDGRFRYPEQSTDDLGLPIAGTVPQFPKGGIDQRSAEQMFQLVESFRTLRMSVLQASNGGVSLAVSSAAPGEGKSLISANLAMSFADAGLRTVLVDGDTRRGTLHQMFGMPSAPGLTDYLAGAAEYKDVVLQTTNDRLSILPCGTRQSRSPELLTSPRLRELVTQLRATFDAVIVDTPPLAAGIDGYSIASATGSLIVVLRVGQTQRRMASEKLRVLDRLPVDVIGSVLNGVDFKDGYEYYGYVPGYEAEDEPGTALTPV